MNRITSSVFISLLLAACTSTTYDTGDGDYSYYSAEMSTFLLDKAKIDAGTLDDGRTIHLSTPLDSASVKKQFSPGIEGEKVRMMLHYNIIEESNTQIKVEPIGGNEVYMPKIALADTIKTEIKTDPVKLISTWTSKNGEYFNMNFAIKTGIDDKNNKQQIGLVCDSITTSGDENTVHIRFVHHQNDVPEFYSSDFFLSISKEQLQKLIKDNNKDDSKKLKLQFTINTYDGQKTVKQ